jgi:hypothetical protein
MRITTALPEDITSGELNKSCGAHPRMRKAINTIKLLQLSGPEYFFLNGRQRR